MLLLKTMLLLLEDLNLALLHLHLGLNLYHLDLLVVRLLLMSLSPSRADVPRLYIHPGIVIRW